MALTKTLLNQDLQVKNDTNSAKNHQTAFHLVTNSFKSNWLVLYDFSTKFKPGKTEK